MKLIVTGSRDWVDEDLIEQAFYVFTDSALNRNEQITVVHGDCPTGADAIANWIAENYGFHIRRYPAEWNLHGRGAGPIRNEEMVREHRNADYVLAFPLGESRGTRGCMKIASEAGLTVVNLGEK